MNKNIHYISGQPIIAYMDQWYKRTILNLEHIVAIEEPVKDGVFTILTIGGHSIASPKGLDIDDLENIMLDYFQPRDLCTCDEEGECDD